MASANSDAEILQLLIERNVDVMAIAHYYGIALHAALCLGHLGCMQLLINASSDISLKAGTLKRTPLQAAIKN